MYLGSLAAARSSQGGLRSATLGGRGFWSLAAQVAARGAVYGVPRSAGVVFGPWLLYHTARGVYGVPRALGTVFGSWRLAWQPGRRSQSAALSGRGFWSLAALESSQGCLRCATFGGRGLFLSFPFFMYIDNYLIEVNKVVSTRRVD